MANPKIRESKVALDPKKATLKSGDYLVATNGDQFITEAQYIRIDDLTADEIAYYDNLAANPTSDTYNEAKNLAYRLAKIKESADDKVFATDTQIDGLFATCAPTPEPEPTPTGYTLVTSSEANSANAAVYSALVATIFMKGTKKDEDVDVENITIDSKSPATYPVMLTDEGIIISVDTIAYMLYTTGVFSVIV